MEEWRVFPAETSTEGLDVDKLAQLNVAGGIIWNIALGAAFLAADVGGPVRMEHVLRAARAEYAKLERPLTDAEVVGWGERRTLEIPKSDSTCSRRKPMDEISVLHGGHKVTFRKDKRYFGVRLRHGRASSVRALEARSALPTAPIRHVESLAAARIDVFCVEDENQLEEAMAELRAAAASGVVTHLYLTGTDDSFPVIPTGFMTIRFEPKVKAGRCTKILKKNGLQVVERLGNLPGAMVVRVTEQAKANPLKIAAQLQSSKDIALAEPDIGVQVSFSYTPTDTHYQSQWHLNNDGGMPGLKEGADVSAEDAWDIARGDRGITVCVIDDGFDLNHPDFMGVAKVVAPRDFGQDDQDPSPVRRDDNHGTACAGVAIAEENGQGVVGLAPDCAFMPVRMSRLLMDATIESMFGHAKDAGADVISCSWSASAPYFPLSTRMSAAIHEAATQGRANGKGCVILFAAGNEDRLLFDPDNGILQGFALHPDVIAVGASNSLDERSYYSNYGPELTLCAPSSGAGGRGVVTTDRLGRLGYSKSDYTSNFGGTSSATPLAAGLAALILSVNPELTSAEVRQLMTGTADKIDQANGAYDANGHSELYGYGRINADRALQAASGRGDRQPRTLYLEHRVNVPIEDLSNVQIVIPFPLDERATAIEVSIDIQHTWRGDLHVTLRTPSNTEIPLHSGTGGSEDDLVRTFRSSDEPERFADVVGKSAKGDWALIVEDRLRGDVGVLRKWGLAVTY